MRRRLISPTPSEITPIPCNYARWLLCSVVKLTFLSACFYTSAHHLFGSKSAFFLETKLCDYVRTLRCYYEVHFACWAFRK